MGPRPAFTMPVGENTEEVDLHEYVASQESSNSRHREAYSEDEEDNYSYFADRFGEEFRVLSSESNRIPIRVVTLVRIHVNDTFSVSMNLYISSVYFVCNGCCVFFVRKNRYIIFLVYTRFLLYRSFTKANLYRVI